MTKEAFLKRVRGALGRRPGQAAAGPPALLPPLTRWDAAELAERFTAELELVGGRVHRVANVSAARTCLRALAADTGARSFVRGADELVSEVVDTLVEELGIPEAADPAEADLGLTGARCGIAATGTLVLTSETGRKASLLPMTHVALLGAEQLVPTMAEALENYQQEHGEMPSAWVQATGPSRTADIELTLTTGVHGPGFAHVILIGP